MVFNDTVEDQAAEIDLRKSYRQATELHGGEATLAGGNTLHVKVAYQSVPWCD